MLEHLFRIITSFKEKLDSNRKEIFDVVTGKTEKDNKEILMELKDMEKPGGIIEMKATKKSKTRRKKKIIESKEGLE